MKHRWYLNHRQVMAQLRIAVAGSLCALAVLACSNKSNLPKQSPSISKPPMLNSERIKNQFGNYDVEVLQQNARYRISSLYSQDSAGCRTTRTLALVVFADTAATIFGDVHQAILDGSSIGATLHAAGYTVAKEHLAAGEIDSGELAIHAGRLVKDETTKIASHRYQLHAADKNARHRYAQILEFHHPDYLTLADLNAHYGILNSLILTDQEREELGLSTNLDIATCN